MLLLLVTLALPSHATGDTSSETGDTVDTGTPVTGDTGESEDTSDPSTFDTSFGFFTSGFDDPASDLAGEKGGSQWPGCNNTAGVGLTGWLGVACLVGLRRRSRS